MKLSSVPYNRAIWPFGRNAVLVWQKKSRSKSKDGGRAVSIPIEDATPRHDPVMVREILEDFQLQPGDIVFDGTLGLGGHSSVFVDQIRPGGILVGTDWDDSMLAEARSRLAPAIGAADVETRLVRADFRDLPQLSIGWDLRADAILLDLGLNSAQVDDPTRGFSFRGDGPLDMRMDRAQGEPASAVLNRMTPAQIEETLHDFGDERWARAIAKQIVERRKAKPLKTTQDLVDCVLAAIPPGAREKRIHPATRTFQALRIYVNAELDGLGEAIRDLADRLAPGGTLCVLSYHSGEDRIVKQVFRELAANGFQDLHKKPLGAADAEVRANPRARSAKLRSLRKNDLNSEEDTSEL